MSKVMKFGKLMSRIEELDRTMEFSVREAEKSDLQRFVNEYCRFYDFYCGRSSLIGLYQDTAMIIFTTSQAAFISCVDIVPDQSHNFNRMRDKIQIKNLDSALAYVGSLPRTLHMLPTIIVDLLELRYMRVCFAITGFIKDLHEPAGQNKIRHFMRYFVLTPVPGTDDDYKISTEVVYMRDATREQLQAGVIPKKSDSYFWLNIIGPFLPGIVAMRQSRQDDSVVRLSQLTHVKCEWCLKCLVEYRWDFQRALTRLRELARDCLIPDFALLATSIF